MQYLADFGSIAAIVGALLALVVTWIVVAWLIRARASRTPPPEPWPVDASADYLDSSHIFRGPAPKGQERRAQGGEGGPPPGGDRARPGAPVSGPRK